MKKILLVDGNNLLFRAYYALRDNGGSLKTTDGIPTNAVYGFLNMINKIITEEKTEYIVVAFDKGKNFRKEKYSFYKEGRSETPTELKEQFPLAKKLLALKGITYIENEPYEADDIIGTLAKKVNLSDSFHAVIVSSDVDLLQLIDNKSEVKLLKQKSNIRYDLQTFKDTYLLDPVNIIDLKSLMGDSSDNIPGVKGVGEKTALKLLQEYKTLDNVYENIESIKGSVKDKLLVDKDNAYMSYELATIYCEVPLDNTLESYLKKDDSSELNDFYKMLQFRSFIKNEEVEVVPTSYVTIDNISELSLEDNISLYAEFDNENYHYSNIIGVSISDKNGNYYINKSLINDLKEVLKNKNISTYNVKKHIKIFGDIFSNDLMVSEFLLSNDRVKEDISHIITDIDSKYFFKELKKKNFMLVKEACTTKSSFIYNKINESLNSLKEENLYELYTDLEMPLINVLYDMEDSGLVCDKEILIEMQKDILVRLDEIKNEIYTLSGVEFNLQSPKQLGDVLFETLGLPGGKKNKKGYTTDAAVLEKLKDKHPVIEKILEFRNLDKLNSTYIVGIMNYIPENKILKALFNQTQTRTGRLSCSEPNLQNIPVRDELGKQIRKAFLPKHDFFLSADYSQIELRIMAHISGDKKLIESFNLNKDIHRSVAADMYNKSEDEVSKSERKTAKAVIFGIVYGISGFGLKENLNITKKEANDFINKYLELYPSVKKYMEDIVSITKTTGYVTTLYNRKRKIPEILNSNFLVRNMGERMALNTPIQGTSADIIKDAMIKIHRDIKKYNLKSEMVLQVHDELIFDVYEEEKEIITKIVIENMENVIKLDVPLKVEVSTGRNWFEV